jgi:hypothetical protein
MTLTKYIIIDKKNEVYLKVEADDAIRRELGEYFTFEVPGYKFTPQFRNRFWDGKIRLFSYATGQIFTGLYPYIVKWCNDNKIQIQFKVAVNEPLFGNRNSIYKVSVPVENLTNNEWCLITAIFKNKELNLYVNNILRGTLTLDPNLDINYNYKNNLLIGCPTGKNENLNKEINSQSLIWDGYIDAVRIYDYALNESFIQYFLKEKIQGNDMTWNIITAPLQYVEEVDKFFKHRVPGHKSNYFNIKINQSKIIDSQTRKIIEDDIKIALQNIIPANTELLNIQWADE